MAIETKRDWRALQARRKALPSDYQIVYKEMQKYLFKLGQVEALEQLIEIFEEGTAHGKPVLDVTGKDVAAFADELIKS